MVDPTSSIVLEQALKILLSRIGIGHSRPFLHD
jgi:hypothetical protein